MCGLSADEFSKLNMASLLYRQQVQDDVLRFLSDPVNGFNANLTASAAVFANQSPFALDFSGAAGNFALSDIKEPENSQLTSIDTQPCACLFGALAKNDDTPRGLHFAGAVLMGIRFFVRYRAGTPPFDTESIMNWIEAALQAALDNPALFWTQSGAVSVLYQRQSSMERNGFIEQLADGWQQVIEFAIPFQVFCN